MVMMVTRSVGRLGEVLYDDDVGNAASPLDAAYPPGTQFRTRIRIPTTDGNISRPASLPPATNLDHGFEYNSDGTTSWVDKWSVATSVSPRAVLQTVRSWYDVFASRIVNANVEVLYGARPAGSTPGAGTPPQASQCTSRGGQCMDVGACTADGRVSIPNLCPETPANIRCCMPRGYAAPGSGGRSGGGRSTPAPAGGGQVAATSASWPAWKWAATGGAAGLALLLIVKLIRGGKRGNRRVGRRPRRRTRR